MTILIEVLNELSMASDEVKAVMPPEIRQMHSEAFKVTPSQETIALAVKGALFAFTEYRPDMTDPDINKLILKGVILAKENGNEQAGWLGMLIFWCCLIGMAELGYRDWEQIFSDFQHKDLEEIRRNHVSHVFPIQIHLN